MKPVLFVGDKPSKKNLDAEIAFVGTKSHKVLLDWIDQMGVEEYSMVNRVSPMFMDKVNWHTSNKGKIVALGNEASKALEKLNIEHFKLPHPSGLNRKLNNKQQLALTLYYCMSYILDLDDYK